MVLPVVIHREWVEEGEQHATGSKEAREGRGGR